MDGNSSGLRRAPTLLAEHTALVLLHGSGKLPVIFCYHRILLVTEAEILSHFVASNWGVEEWGVNICGCFLHSIYGYSGRIPIRLNPGLLPSNFIYYWFG